MEPNGIKKKIKEVLESNGWVDEVKLAEKIKYPVLEVDKALMELQKEGLVDVRPAK